MRQQFEPAALGPLERLYARHAAIAAQGGEGDSGEIHERILDRLSENRRVAESKGWTLLALERVGGMGRLRLRGVPPSSERREVVPDWAATQPIHPTNPRT